MKGVGYIAIATIGALLFMSFRRKGSTIAISNNTANNNTTPSNTTTGTGIVNIEAIENEFGPLTSEQLLNLNKIIQAFGVYGDGDSSKLYYIIATVWHESRLKAVRECFATTDAKARQCVQGRSYATPINGHVYYGRGFVQLTWLENYQKMSTYLGVDLVNNPDLALQPDYAAKILVYGMINGSFTGLKLSDFINPTNAYNDFYNARKVVNGLNKANLINTYTVNMLNYQNSSIV